ncbi:10421_t:CDS:2, partial [Racocetra fulgida]
GYKTPDDGPSEYQTIPLSKIEDFGVHCKQYVVNRDYSAEQIADLAEKLDQAETQLQQSGRVSSFPGGMGGSRSSVTSSQSVGGSSAGGATATAPPPEKKRVEESPL